MNHQNEHEIQRELTILLRNQRFSKKNKHGQMGMRVLSSANKQEYLRNIADFRRKKQRNWRIHTHKWQIHPENDSFTPIIHSRYVTHKAVRIDVRVKISWHPHPAYPPLSTLKARPFAFTHTLREIDPCWIPIFTEYTQELHRNPSNLLQIWFNF